MAGPDSGTFTVRMSITSATNPTGAQGYQRRRYPETKKKSNNAKPVVWFDHPLHRVHSGTDSEWCTESCFGCQTQAGQKRAPDQYSRHKGCLPGLALRPANQPCHRTAPKSGKNPKYQCTQEVARFYSCEEVCQFRRVEESQRVVIRQLNVGEVNPQANFWVIEKRNYRLSSDHVYVDDITGRRSEKGGKKGSSIDVIPVGGFEGEKNSSSGGLKHSCYTSCRASGKEDLYIFTTQPSAETL